MGVLLSTGWARKGDVASICGARVLNGEGFDGDRESEEGTLRTIPGRAGGSIAAGDGKFTDADGDRMSAWGSWIVCEP